VRGVVDFVDDAGAGVGRGGRWVRGTLQEFLDNGLRASAIKKSIRALEGGAGEV
jgi:hypothetical protein